MARMNLMILLDTLEQTVQSSPRLPLTDKIIVDQEALLALVDKIRNALPEEVRRAEWIASEKERVLADSQREAERIVAQAKEYVGRLLDENHITARAREEAGRIVSEAERYAQDTRRGASEYAIGTLGELAERLERTLKVVRRGIEELRADLESTAAIREAAAAGQTAAPGALGAARPRSGGTDAKDDHLQVFEGGGNQPRRSEKEENHAQGAQAHAQAADKARGHGGRSYR